MNADISVIIPLYNKEREIERTLRSALAQTLPAREIIVVDDGSTDRSAEIVARIASQAPSVRLIRQPNAGVCAARNRAVAASSGELVALLDADDVWRPGFLAEIASLRAAWPGCGLYCTAFDIAAADGEYPAPTHTERGIVDDFFARSAHRYIAIPSAAAIPRRIFDEAGGFPVGMKMGEDLYLWIRIASRHPVCFSPERLVCYSKEASNRSAAIWTPEQTRYTFEELYDPSASEAQNEFVARAALGRALVISAKGGTAEAARAVRFFGYTKIYRRTLRKVRILNMLPVGWRQPLLRLYNALAWRLARRGL